MIIVSVHVHYFCFFSFFSLCQTGYVRLHRLHQLRQFMLEGRDVELDNNTFVNKKEFSWRNKQGGHINFVQLCLQTN